MLKTPRLTVYGGRTIQMTLGFGVWVITVFAVLFMFYTSLIKRRKRSLACSTSWAWEKAPGRVLAIETAPGVRLHLAGILLGAAFTGSCSCCAA